MGSQSIKPYQVAGRKTWAVTYTHPSKGRRNRNLGTENEIEAKTKALDLERILNDPSIWDAQPDDERLRDFDPRAIEAFFDFLPQPKKALTKIDPEHHESLRKVLNALDSIPAQQRPPASIRVATTDANEARQKQADAERKIARLEQEKAALESENRDYRRKLNKHCTTKLEAAVAEFQTHYKGRTKHTTGQVNAVLKSFSTCVIGGKPLGVQLLGDVHSNHINNWLADYKGTRKNATGVSQTTRAKCRRYLSTFWTWAFTHYDLSENPIEKALPVAGTAPEHIVAIRRYEDLIALIDGLADWPYWQAWVAVAVLAGPRFTEQVYLKTSDVLLESNYIRIATRASGRVKTGPKTGKERNVPVEQTKLLPILKKHLQTLTSNTPWLFPSLAEAPANPKQLRSSIWRNETFMDYWLTKKKRVGISDLARQKAKSEAEYWNYSQSEWRHCAGTAMGHAGLSALQISQWLGNSEDICRRHYIAPIGARPWPLKYHGDSETSSEGTANDTPRDLSRDPLPRDAQHSNRSASR
ncbi:MAG TPA: hypothetical protein VGP72_00535 [Planctomycetota bacterium]